MSLGSLPGCAAPAGSSPLGRPWLSLCRVDAIHGGTPGKSNVGVVLWVAETEESGSVADLERVLRDTRESGEEDEMISTPEGPAARTPPTSSPGRFKTREEYQAWIAAGRPPEAPAQPPGTTPLSPVIDRALAGLGRGAQRILAGTLTPATPAPATSSPSRLLGIALLTLGLLWTIWGVLGTLSLLGGQSMGRGYGMLGIMALFVVPGLLVAACGAALRRRPNPVSVTVMPEVSPAPGDRRPCPFCAELILAAAKVCRYCRRELFPPSRQREPM